MLKSKKVTIKDWAMVLVALLDDIAVLVLVLLALWFFKIKIPLPAAIVIALVVGTLVFIVHKAIIPSFHRKIVTGSEGMVGLEGKVVEPLTPFGVVRLKGEYWKAKSIDEEIMADEDIEVLAVNNFTLEVRRKSQ